MNTMDCLEFFLFAFLVVLSKATSTLAQGLENEPITNDTSLRWGPYRPNLYFGIRPLIPDSVLMGLMWANGESMDTMLQSQ